MFAFPNTKQKDPQTPNERHEDGGGPVAAYATSLPSHQDFVKLLTTGAPGAKVKGSHSEAHTSFITETDMSSHFESPAWSQVAQPPSVSVHSTSSYAFHSPIRAPSRYEVVEENIGTPYSDSHVKLSVRAAVIILIYIHACIYIYFFPLANVA